ncbi:MAG TPA: NAD(P)/FAD-dependent oxidoreductase [Candidatus Paceibacterota bacterium]|nr:NAD(P)/FAD-dependent oxidoreductase [Candidatus Paceibacterota bacterium]
MKNIVILGAGFGGLRAAMDISKELRRLKLLDAYAVTLVDHNDCHLYTPMLYKLAASPENPSRNACSYDVSALIKGYPIRFVESEIAAIDLINGDLHLKAGEEIRADYLVLALGSETNFFGIPGLKENSLQLKTVDGAMAIHEKIKAIFARGGNVKIVAGGAGPNGIELAAEVRMWANKEEKRNPNLRVSVSIVEALPQVLTGMDSQVQKIAAHRLARLGVEVMLGAKIVSVSDKEISIDGGEKIPFDAFVWTGGVKTPDILTQLPLQKEPHGKPVAQASMTCLPATPDLKLAPMIYAIGDSVCFMNPKTGHPMPAVAHVAILEGSVAARNLVEEIKKTEFPNYQLQITDYVPSDYPYVVVAGSGWAVARIGPFVFSGWPGWAFESLVELYYLLSIMPFVAAVKTWLR